MTIHLIYTANPYPQEDIYLGCQKDLHQTTAVFKRIDKWACAAGYDLRVDFHYPDYEKQVVMDYIKKLPTKSDDAVIFVFSGHGIQDTAGGKWPLLYYGPQPQQEIAFEKCALALANIHYALQAKGVRMSLVLASSCNHNPLGVAAEQSFGGENNDLLSAKRIGGRMHDFELLTTYCGHIIASACKRGQEAYLTDRDGSIFISAFLKSLICGLKDEDGTTWRNVLQSAGVRIERQYGVQQDIQYQLSPQS